MSKALVLSGGSIKGAYQAGAIQSVLAAGFYPDLICGISTGSLGGSFLINALGAATDQAPTPAQWQAAAQALIDFYTTRITGPDVVIRKRGLLSILWATLTKNFKGLTDTAPLHNLLTATLKKEQMARCPVALRVGAVNVASGQIVYADAANADIVDFIYASTAEPVVMPTVQVAGADYVDGGLRDVAPIGDAINRGAREMVVIVCQPEHFAPQAIDPHNPLQLAGRLMDIVTDGIIRADLKQVEQVNRQVRFHGADSARALLKPYEEIKWKLIQPPDEIRVQIDQFTPKDIQDMIDYGRALGREVMGQSWGNVAI